MELRNRLEKMRHYGLPAKRVYRTLIDFASTLDERKNLYRLFDKSIAACQYHPESAAPMGNSPAENYSAALVRDVKRQLAINAGQRGRTGK